MTGHVVMTGALHWHQVAVVFAHHHGWSVRWVWPFRITAPHLLHCPAGELPDARTGCIAT